MWKLCSNQNFSNRARRRLIVFFNFEFLVSDADSQLEDFIDGSRRYYEVRHPSYFSCVKLLKRLEVRMKDRGALVCEMSLFHVVVDGVIKL